MGQITSGVGLVSGLPIAEIVDQLIAIESRPKQIIQSRVAVLQSQQVAFQNINAKLLALKLSVTNLASSTTFSGTTTSSTNENVLAATSSTSATPGSYNFIVDRLVSTQQMITQGFADSNTTAIGAATLTFEFGNGRLDTDTDLGLLNGGAGTIRGKIRITDRSGASQVVDLSKALTANDVLTAINNTSTISVTASISGDKFVIHDTSGSTTTSLSVADTGASGTTASLGLDAAAVGDTLTGNQINLITADTPLSILNDGRGVDINHAIPDHLRLRLRTGDFFNVDLTGATTVGDVLDAINTQLAGKVNAAIDAGNTGINIQHTGPDLGFMFEVFTTNNSSAAIDLGIVGPGDDGSSSGGRLIAAINSKLVKNLNGGAGATFGEISITNRSGVTTSVMLDSAGSVSEGIGLINAADADVTASINQAGNGILLTDQTGDTASDLIVADISGTAATDLKIVGSFTADRVDSGNLQYQYIFASTLLASLNGGQGISRGQFTITDSSGVTATVDLSQGNETTVQDVLDEINSRGLLINAEINNTGDGILIEDLGPGTIKLAVNESGSSTAADLGLLGEAANFSDNLDGRFEKTVAVDAADTLNDIAQKINDAGIGVTATIINDGSASSPFRLSLTAKESGSAGAFVFDDGTSNFNAISLSQARDAAVFFGSTDPATGIAIQTSSNTLSNIVPGTTIDLKDTSDSPVQITITRDDSAITGAIQHFVDDFNNVVDTLDNLDGYDSETEQRGLLLGDSTISVVRTSLFRLANTRISDLTGQFNNLAQLGITIGAGARMRFDSDRFEQAMAADRDAVEEIFTFKETEKDQATGDITLIAGGIGARFDQLLASLTDSVAGTLQSRINAIDRQVQMSNRRIEQLNDKLADKRARLEAQFAAMEQAIARIQGQSSALASLQALALSTFGMS